jgi:hypothetical protein
MLSRGSYKNKAFKVIAIPKKKIHTLRQKLLSKEGEVVLLKLLTQ